RVQVVLKTNTVQVRTLETAQVEVRLRDAGGALRARAERLVPAVGIQDINLYTTSGFPAVIQPGDSVVITLEGADPVVITPVYLDARPVAGSDTIVLEGPPNEELGVQIQVPGEVLPKQFTTTTDDEGLATLDLTGIVDLSPGVGGWVAYAPETKRAVLVSFQVPTAVAKVGSDWIEGYAWAEREVSLTLEDNPSTPRQARDAAGSGHRTGQAIATTRLLTDGKGYFSTRLAEEFANLRIHPGQTIRVTWENQQIALAVPQLSIRADPATDQITGRGPVGADLSITIYDQATQRRRWYYPTPDENGQYQVNLAGRVDITPDDDGSVIYEAPDGHKLVAEFRVPLVGLEVGRHTVSGRGVESAEVVVDLRAGDGTVKATAQTTVDTRGNFALELEAGGQPVPVSAGDTLQITVGDEQIAIDVPALAVDLDPVQDRVIGQGPPGESLQISLVAGDDRLTQDVTPSASGNYSLDVRGLADIRAGAYATATYTTPDEHKISAQDRLTQVTVQVGANYIEGTADRDTVVDVFVRGAGGQLKDWAQSTANNGGRFATNTTVDCRTPVVITAGDEIEVTTGAANTSLVVPNLTVALDAESDQVAGTGPAGATIEVRLSATDGHRRDEITIEDDGRYSLTYAPDADVRPGDSVTVVFVNRDGHEILARANVPSLSATIGKAGLRGSVAPLETVHVTLRDGQGTLKAEATVTSNHNGSIGLIFASDTGQPAPIEAGDLLEVETASTTYRLQVPPLSLTLDPAGPTATGTTLPNATVDLTFVTQSRLYLQHVVTADADGHYETTFDPDIAVRAGNWVRARITTPEGFEAAALWSAAYLTAHAGTNYVEVQMEPPAPITVTLRSSAGTLRATGSSDPANDDAYLFTSDGQPVVIQSGDRIVLEQAGVDEITAVTVPDLTMNLAPELGGVHGTGPAGSKVSVSVTGTGGEDSRHALVPVWADGTYGARFAGLEMGPGASGRVSYADAETGHGIVLETNRGWFRAQVEESAIEVRAAPLSEVTLRLRGVSGTTKGETQPISVDHRGRATVELWTVDGTPAVIQAGDYLELTATDGVTGLTIPEVPFEIDIAGGRVLGTVPGRGTTPALSPAEVLVTLSTSDGCIYHRQPRPSPDGHFQTDFSYDTDIRPGDGVTLRYTTRAGHELEIRRSIHAGYLPLIIHD
ncbi:MAG: hypothetical protein ACE5LU_25465, partial [Anaerolineae bacterium]